MFEVFCLLIHKLTRAYSITYLMVVKHYFQHLTSEVKAKKVKSNSFPANQTIWTDIKQSQIQTKSVKTDLLGKPDGLVLLKAFSPRDAEEHLFWDTLIQTWSRLWEARVGKHLENSLNPGWGLSATFQDCVCSDFFPRAFSVPLWTFLWGKRRESPVKDESSASVQWCSLISL